MTLQPIPHDLKKCSCSTCLQKREQNASHLVARRWWDQEARASHEALSIFLAGETWMVTYRSKYYKTKRTFTNTEPITLWNKKAKAHDITIP